jgi:hypothetical protein
MIWFTDDSGVQGAVGPGLALTTQSGASPQDVPHWEVPPSLASAEKGVGLLWSLPP